VSPSEKCLFCETEEKLVNANLVKTTRAG